MGSVPVVGDQGRHNFGKWIKSDKFSGNF